MRKEFLILLILVVCSGCTQSYREQSAEAAPNDTSWQEYYDLGVRCLSEGNYDEAIIAFSAAIEIDAKQALAYAGRGDAYWGANASLGENSDAEARNEIYKKSLDDYVTAIELDGNTATWYRKAAEIYLALEEMDSAIAILSQGIVKTGDDELRAFLAEISVHEPETDISSDVITTFREYVSPDDLSPEQLEFISKLISYVEDEDTSTIFSLRENAFNTLPHYNESQVNFYSLVDNYKLQICVLPEYGSLSVELRSHNKAAYYCEVRSSDVVREEYDFMRGTCENWQWNGEVNATRDERWHNGTLFYQETSVTAENNYRIGEDRTITYWKGLEAGNPVEDVMYYNEKDKMPLPWGIHEMW